MEYEMLLSRSMSTVNSNPVLADHVARAEITKNGAVFIDQDPKHFDSS
jgi:hypothetical protein